MIVTVYFPQALIPVAGLFFLAAMWKVIREFLLG